LKTIDVLADPAIIAQPNPTIAELHSMVIKALGMDQTLESIIKRLDKLCWFFLVPMRWMGTGNLF
jgi:hypothetical protein